MTMRPMFEQVKKILDKINPHKVSPVDMMMNLVCILSNQSLSFTVIKIIQLLKA